MCGRTQDGRITRRMCPVNYYELSAAQLHKMLVSKECSAVEVTQSVLDRIDAVEDKVESYLCVTKERALEDAR